MPGYSIKQLPLTVAMILSRRWPKQAHLNCAPSLTLFDTVILTHLCALKEKFSPTHQISLKIYPQKKSTFRRKAEMPDVTRELFFYYYYY